VPEISDLYKRHPKKWEDEARARTERDATVEKLEEIERELDGGVEGERLDESDDKENDKTNEEKADDSDGSRDPKRIKR
jgi:hypothetical protein